MTGRTVLVGDDLPELGADLVAALATLHVDDLAHLEEWVGVRREGVSVVLPTGVGGVPGFEFRGSFL